MIPVAKVLKERFQHLSFRPGQEEIIKSIIDGHDTVAIMPTGGGKSLCYQLPALFIDGVTLIVSPLIALMKDQVDSLTIRGIPATYINSALPPDEIAERLKLVLNQKVKLLYIAPERFVSSGFTSVLTKLAVSLVAVDEAHCISQWGHDFRPEYRELKTYITHLSQRPIIAAFTATATPEVAQDIITRLRLDRPHLYVRGFDRPNLRFFVRANIPLKTRREETLHLIQKLTGSGVVYTLTIKDAESTAVYLSERGIPARAYHSKLDSKEKTTIQDDFMENRYKVIVATIAFGMGIDKADVRFVIHQGMPPSLERYYQEAGRAGRDGERAYCILLHSKRDRATHHYFILEDRKLMRAQGRSATEIQQQLGVKYKLLNTIHTYVTTPSCRRRFILTYFGDPQVTGLKSPCRGCDRCLNYAWKNQTALEPNPQEKKTVLSPEFSDTVRETIRLYQVGHPPSEIATIRGLGMSTIMTHLIKWYLAGGNLPVDKYVSVAEQQQILAAMSRADNYQKLSSIKQRLPESISYEKIRLVIAKIHKIQLS